MYHGCKGLRAHRHDSADHCLADPHLTADGKERRVDEFHVQRARLSWQTASEGEVLEVETAAGQWRRDDKCHDNAHYGLVRRHQLPPPRMRARSELPAEGNSMGLTIPGPVHSGIGIFSHSSRVVS